MAQYKREDAQKVFQIIKNGKVLPIYLVIGDRFLCRQFADDLVKNLLTDSRQVKQNLHLIDGGRESPLSTLNLLKTYSLFPGRQVFKVSDSRLFLSKAVAKPFWGKAVKAATENDFKLAGKYLRKVIHVGKLVVEAPDDLTSLSAQKWKSVFGFTKPQDNMAWVEKALNAHGASDVTVSTSGKGEADHYMEAFEAGIPENNILILLAEEVDKRKRFFKFIKNEGAILDLSVSTGSTKAAKTDQESVLRGLISKTLAGFSKNIAPNAIPVLLERVGFHPVAVVRETEKLALYAGEETSITLQDVNAVVGRTREDALYELTESYSDKNMTKALQISTRMLESGVHPLVLVSGLRNHLRKLLLVCSFRKQSSPVFVEGMSYGAFQKGYLAQLKAEKEELLKSLPNHPYALFMMFEKAGKHSIQHLVKGLRKLLEAEFRMKSSPLPGQLVFENFLFEMLI